MIRESGQVSEEPDASSHVSTSPVNPSPLQPFDRQPDRAALDRSLVHGLAWTGAAKWATQLLSWLSMLVVARLLTPADFGLVGAAAVYLGLVNLVSELGLGGAIVQRRDLTEDQIARLGGMSVVFGFLLAALSCALAVPISAFFRDRAVAGVVAVMSVTFITNGAQVVPRALLMQDLRFRTLSLVEALQAAAGAVFTLALAVLGARYWALVLSNVATAALVTAILVARRPHRIAWPRHFASIRGALTFGWHIVASRVAWYGYSNADFAVVGRMLGSAALGLYSVGWTIASIAVDRISALVGRVVPGIFSAVQHDTAAFRRYVLLLTEGLALVTFPVSAGLAITADDLVGLALGEKWLSAVLPLRLLCLYAGFRSITTLLSHILVGAGRARDSMRYSVLGLAVMPPLFVLGSRYGTAGVAAAWIVGYPLIVFPAYRRVFSLLDLRLEAYLKAIAPALGGSLLMLGAVAAARLLAGDATPALRLAIQVATGVVVYAVVTVLPQRERLRRILRQMRQTVQFHAAAS
jgi:PST family polysaccharide transporter